MSLCTCASLTRFSFFRYFARNQPLRDIEHWRPGGGVGGGGGREPSGLRTNVLPRLIRSTMIVPVAVGVLVVLMLRTCQQPAKRQRQPSLVEGYSRRTIRLL